MAVTDLIDVILNVLTIIAPLATQEKADAVEIIIETGIATVVLVTPLTLQKTEAPVESVVVDSMRTTLESLTMDVIRTIVVLAARLSPLQDVVMKAM
ncbi:hypothetical protein H1R20_g3819, partial [Candolleomyces eurysporus]